MYAVAPITNYYYNYEEFSDHGNESSVLIKCGEFLEWLSHY
jgi:hypothetical protein